MNPSTTSVTERPAFFFGDAWTYQTGVIWIAPGLAMVVALVLAVEPSLFLPLLVANIWLLGYHHVIATFTRTAMDAEMWRKHWILNAPLFLTVFLAVLMLVKAGGVALVATIYIHWQLFHYVRQSEGIGKSLASPHQINSVLSTWSVRGFFYLLPVAAFLTVCAHGASDRFLGMPMWTVEISLPGLAAVWLAVLCLGALSIQRLFPGTNESRANGGAYLKYLCGHVLVFGIAYAASNNLESSWLIASCWHNLQYLIFVGKANRKRFSDGVDAKAPLLSTLSQTGNAWLYIAFCLTATVAVYYALESVQPSIQSWLGLSALASMVLIYQTVNFHHYIVDAIIWRRQRRLTSGVESRLRASG